MRRRDLVALLGGAAFAWPNLLAAQQSGKTSRIGVLGWNIANPVMTPAYRSLVEELRRLGFNEGQNLTIEVRPSDQDMPKLVTAANGTHRPEGRRPSRARNGIHPEGGAGGNTAGSDRVRR